jgi:hypothetical protein
VKGDGHEREVAAVATNDLVKPGALGQPQLVDGIMAAHTVCLAANDGGHGVCDHPGDSDTCCQLFEEELYFLCNSVALFVGRLYSTV